MSLLLPSHYDLYVPPAGKMLSVRALTSYPFKYASPADFTATVHERDYLIDPGNYTPRLSVTGPRDTDPDDGTAYLVEESDPPARTSSRRAVITRTFARIPGTQYEPASLLFDRPSLHDVVSGSVYAVSFDGGRTSHLFNSRKAINVIASLAAPTKTVTGDVDGTGSIAGEYSGLPTVVITITGNNSTRTFNADASDSTIQDALSNAVTGSTASAANFKILRNFGALSVTVITTNTTISALSSPSAEVEVDCPVGIGVATGSGPSEILRLTAQPLDTRATVDTHDLTETYSVSASVRTFTTSAAHGAAVGDRVAFWNGPRVVATSIVTAVPTSTTFKVPLEDVPGADFAASTCAFDSAAWYRVANGAVDCSARRVRRFYLPGVTGGISSMADIPAQTPVTRDPVSWLGAVVSYLTTPSAATYAIDQTEDVRVWMGPILEKPVVELQMQDAVKTLAVT